MLLQHLLEVPTRMASGMLRHLLRCARHHDLAALIAAFWSGDFQESCHSLAAI